MQCTDCCAICREDEKRFRPTIASVAFGFEMLVYTQSNAQMDSTHYTAIAPVDEGDAERDMQAAAIIS